jgi:hypothetical protein
MNILITLFVRAVFVVARTSRATAASPDLRSARVVFGEVYNTR